MRRAGDQLPRAEDGCRRATERQIVVIFVQEVYEIAHRQPAWTTPYQTRDFENVEVPGRREFVGTVGPEAVRTRYVGKSVRTCFSRGAQNPITYVNIPI